MNQQVFSHTVLRTFARQVLEAEGVRPDHAETIADTLLFADLRGIGSHGISRLALYLARTDAGAMVIDPEMPVISDAPAAALIDAANGFGQVAAVKAMDLAIAKAGAAGSGVVGVRNSNHFGVAAYYALRAARAGMIGIVFTNSSPAMVPYNTKVRLLGTNPLAVGVPAGAAEPIVLDMSTSLVARGKIRRAAIVGEKIPLGWAVDEDGRPTDDPDAAMKGSVAPIGGAKGAGLSLIIDLLAGVLTGTAMTGEVKNISDLSGPSQTGHLMMAIDVGRFMPGDDFQARIDVIGASIRSLPSADGGPVFLPGEIESATESRRRTEGIPVPADVLADLGRLAARHPGTEFVDLAAV